MNNDPGLRMASFHGNFFVRSTDLLAMPAVPLDQSYVIELQIEETITSPFVVLQTAILHTTCYGKELPTYARLFADFTRRGATYPRHYPGVTNHDELVRSIRIR